jgi:hypothetical protein
MSVRLVEQPDDKPVGTFDDETAAHAEVMKRQSEARAAGVPWQQWPKFRIVPA